MNIPTAQKLAVLGSTGSIGKQTLEIVRRNPGLFEITTLTANNNWQDLAAQAAELGPDSVVIADDKFYLPLKEALSHLPIKVYAGKDAIGQVASADNVDTVVVALVGYCGLPPTVSALKKGKKVALANKESLVVAGDIIMKLSAQYNAPVLPIDSEHSAIFQCLAGEYSQIEKVILTASGGPFLDRNADELSKVTIEEALSHPSWEMGDKITIDSATMMNKGFEVIEARWLFSLEPQQIEVVVHPGSVIHSMVQFSDGSVKAQLGAPDMRIPIQYALTFPRRIDLPGQRLDFHSLGSLEFRRPDLDKFPCLALAYETLRRGGNTGCILNAANETAVSAFLQGRIKFTDIARINETALSRAPFIKSPTLEDYHLTDTETRRLAEKLISFT